MRFLKENEKWRTTRKKELSTLLKNNVAGDTRRMDWDLFFYLLFLFLLLLVHFCFYFFFRFNKTKRKIESILSSPARRRNYCPSRDGNHLGRFDTIDIWMSLIIHHFNTIFFRLFWKKKLRIKLTQLEHHAWCK